MNSGLLAAVTAAAALASFGTAQALTAIDFEADAPGVKAEGFNSGGFPELSFFTDLGAGLELGDVGDQGDGVSMLARNDSNGNFLKGVFNDGAHSFLSMDFGNDDAFFSNPGDRAVLTVYLGAALVGQTFVVMNRNDIMDQTIGFGFGPFDNWTLAYTDAAGNPFTGGGGAAVGLIEVIDNITYDTLGGGGAIPEPSLWALMILGFGGVGSILRQRRRTALA